MRIIHVNQPITVVHSNAVSLQHPAFNPSAGSCDLPCTDIAAKTQQEAVHAVECNQNSLTCARTPSSSSVRSSNQKVRALRRIPAPSAGRKLPLIKRTALHPAQPTQNSTIEAASGTSVLPMEDLEVSGNATKVDAGELNVTGAAVYATQGLIAGAAQAGIARVADHFIPRSANSGVNAVRDFAIGTSTMAAGSFLATQGVNKAAEHLPTAISEYFKVGPCPGGILAGVSFYAGKVFFEWAMNQIGFLSKLEPSPAQPPVENVNVALALEDLKGGPADSLVGQNVYLAEKCLICYDPEPDVMAMPCGHVSYCLADFQNRLSDHHKESCPTCRCPVSMFVHLRIRRE